MTQPAPIFDRAGLKAELERLAGNLASRGVKVKPLVFEPPATVAQVAAAEAQIGAPLPDSFRRVLLEVSQHVEFVWFEDREFPAPFQQNFSGDLHWSIELMPYFEEGRQGWIDAQFSNPADPYDVVWHDKVVFYEVGNGDHFAFDRSGAVIYLSHDGGEGHGYQLANSFDDLLARWLPLACVGGSDWQWLPFTADASSGLDPTTKHAGAWRSVVGI